MKMKTAALKTSKIFVNFFLYLSYVNLILGPLIFIGIGYGFSYLINSGQVNQINTNEVTGGSSKAMLFIENFNFNTNSNILKISLLILFYLASAVITIYLMRTLKKILASLETKFTFNTTIFSNLKKITKALICFFIVSIITEALANLAFYGNFKITIHLMTMSVVLIMMYVIIEIFKYGIKIQEEQDLTV